MKNLFSMLSEAQMQSLTKEERDQLYKIDQKLFPDDGSGNGGGGETGLHNNDWLKKKLAAMDAERKENEKYAQSLEADFV